MKGRFTLYNFRHTFATLHLESGTLIKIVSVRLGHANIAQTKNTYQHVTRDVSAGWAKRHVEALDAPDDADD